MGPERRLYEERGCSKKRIGSVLSPASRFEVRMDEIAAQVAESVHIVRHKLDVGVVARSVHAAGPADDLSHDRLEEHAHSLFSKENEDLFEVVS